MTTLSDLLGIPLKPKPQPLTAGLGRGRLGYILGSLQCIYIYVELHSILLHGENDLQSSFGKGPFDARRASVDFEMT